VTDEATDPGAGPASAGAEAGGADALQSWTDAAERPTWTPIESEAEKDAAAADRVRRPSSLGEKISAVTHHGDAAGGSDAGAGTPVAGSRAMPFGGPIGRVRALAAERPEVVVGAAFAGGLVLATILKRLAR